MKKKFVLLLSGLLLLAANAFSQDTNFWIFLCFGQSNMEGFPGVPADYKTNVPSRFQVLASVDFPEKGWTKGHWYTAVPQLCRPYGGVGPTDFFGRTMVSNLPPDIKIGVVIVAVGGCKIELFNQTNYEAYAATAPSWMKQTIQEFGGDPYARLVEMAKLAQKDGVIKGILLHQGESNTGDKQWPMKVKGVYDNLITDLDLDPKQVPLLAGEVVPADEGGICAAMNPIIDTLPQTIPNCYVIPSKGCQCRPQDHLHFTPAGYRELGTRYGDQMLSLMGYPVTATK